MPSEAEFISAVKVAFENAIVSEPFIRNLPVQSLLQKSGKAASQAGGNREWREKRTLFGKLLPSGHLTRLTIEAQKEDSTPEAINGMLLSVVQDRSLGKRKLMDLVEWLDCYHPAISNTLRQVCECEIPDTRFSNKLSSSQSLYGYAKGGQALLCDQCVSALSPLLDASPGNDWEKLYDKIGKSVCPPSKKSAVAKRAGKQTRTILDAWCRLRPLSEATLSQLIRILNDAHLHSAIDALVSHLRIVGESGSVASIIREAQGKAAPFESANTAVASNQCDRVPALSAKAGPEAPVLSDCSMATSLPEESPGTVVASNQCDRVPALSVEVRSVAAVPSDCSMATSLPEEGGVDGSMRKQCGSVPLQSQDCSMSASVLEESGASTSLSEYSIITSGSGADQFEVVTVLPQQESLSQS